MIYKLFRIDHTLIQPYGSRTAMFYSKKLQRIWKPPLHLFSNVLGLHDQIGIKIRKFGDQKLEKCEGVC